MKDHEAQAERPDFIAALRQADDVLVAQPMSPEMQVRLRNRVLARSHGTGARTRGLVLSGFAVAAAVAALVFATRTFYEQAPVEASETVLAESAGFAVRSQSGDLRLETTPTGELNVTQGSAELRSEATGITVANIGEVRLQSEARGVRLTRGKARFSVDKRSPKEGPVHVSVSHGRIEILGTQFTVEQGDGRGSVQLHKGAIRFVANDGTAEGLEPGETLRWPRPVQPKSEELVSEVTQADEPQTAERADVPVVVPKPHEQPIEDEETGRQSVLAELAQLRSRGKYEKAAKLLQAELESARLPERARDQLSYELGTILSTHTREPTKACAHWKQHLRRHGSGRYVTEAQNAMQRLHCQGETE